MQQMQKNIHYVYMGGGVWGRRTLETFNEFNLLIVFTLCV